VLSYLGSFLLCPHLSHTQLGRDLPVHVTLYHHVFLFSHSFRLPTSTTSTSPQNTPSPTSTYAVTRLFLVLSFVAGAILPRYFVPLFLFINCWLVEIATLQYYHRVLFLRLPPFRRRVSSLLHSSCSDMFDMALYFLSHVLPAINHRNSQGFKFYGQITDGEPNHLEEQTSGFRYDKHHFMQLPSLPRSLRDLLPRRTQHLPARNVYPLLVPYPIKYARMGRAPCTPRERAGVWDSRFLLPCLIARGEKIGSSKS